jgi:hypothetical protein
MRDNIVMLATIRLEPSKPFVSFDRFGEGPLDGEEELINPYV